MRDLAIAITAYAVEMLAPAHGSKIARLAGIAVCREHTDLTNHEISTIHDVDHAQPWLARATAERCGHEDADFARGYRLLIDHAQALQRQGGYANANLERGMTRQAGPLMALCTGQATGWPSPGGGRGNNQLRMAYGQHLAGCRKRVVRHAARLRGSMATGARRVDVGLR
jgi:hypothetical protein